MKRGLVVFLSICAVSLSVALMSVVDMFVPKPYDGITPEFTRQDALEVVEVAEASGADQAGIQPGDIILGIGDRLTNSPQQAAVELVRHEIGRPVKYLVKRGEKTFDVHVVPGAIRWGDEFYLYDVIVGALFFLIGLFVWMQRPDDEAARVFFLLSDLFLVFLVCRLRPSSYYWIDYFVQNAGTVALFLLPAVFLHFFLIFPERKRFNLLGADDPYAPPPSALRLRLDRWINQKRALFTLIYSLPPVAYLFHFAAARGNSQLLSGAPAVNWVLLGSYQVLGLVALLHSWVRATDSRKKRQTLPVLLGAIFGTAPFVVFSIFLPSFTGDESGVLFGTVPLVLIPLTFGYAIIRYQLLNVKLVIRRGLLYAVTTALVSALYAFAIATANSMMSTSGASATVAFAVGVAIVLAFDPLRRRLQEPVDRIFFRDRVDFAAAILDMSEAIRGELSVERIKAILTGRVISVTKSSGGWLCLPRVSDGRTFYEIDGSTDETPPPFRGDGSLALHLRTARAPRRLDTLDQLHQDPESAAFLRFAAAAGVRLAVPLLYRSELMGVLFLKEKLSDEEFGREELDVLSTLANQAAVALETAQLHHELTRQVELARDLEIAREIQMSLFPSDLPSPPGVELHAGSIPAKVVGGDFYDVLPFGNGDGDRPERIGLLLGDVSGKSIPASLLMVAGREILWAAAKEGAPTDVVFQEANRRIYSIKRRMFLALGYYILDGASLTLSYSVAGMPTPILCPADGRPPGPIDVPEHRIPLGALKDVPYDACTLSLEPGDLLLLYSDGFSETMNRVGEPFGEERLQQLLSELRHEPLPSIGRRLVDDVARFSGTSDAYDDMTYLLLRVAPIPAASSLAGSRVVQ